MHTREDRYLALLHDTPLIDSRPLTQDRFNTLGGRNPRPNTATQRRSGLLLRDYFEKYKGVHVNRELLHDGRHLKPSKDFNTSDESGKQLLVETYLLSYTELQLYLLQCRQHRNRRRRNSSRWCGW